MQVKPNRVSCSRVYFLTSSFKEHTSRINFSSFKDAIAAAVVTTLIDKLEMILEH